MHTHFRNLPEVLVNDIIMLARPSYPFVNTLKEAFAAVQKSMPSKQYLTEIGKTQHEFTLMFLFAHQSFTKQCRERAKKRKCDRCATMEHNSVLRNSVFFCDICWDTINHKSEGLVLDKPNTSHRGEYYQDPMQCCCVAQSCNHFCQNCYTGPDNCDCFAPEQCWALLEEVASTTPGLFADMVRSAVTSLR